MRSELSRGLFILVVLYSSANTMATQIQNNEVTSLINMRLSYMKDVAGYKAINHLAIEDFFQEGRVLSRSILEAEKLGLDGESVVPFIQAQMDSAKAIQYRYRAEWLSVPEKNWRSIPLEQVRSKISILNTKILTEVSTKLSKGEPFTDKSYFIQQLDQKHLKDSDKEKLWFSLKKIQLKKQP